MTARLKPHAWAAVPALAIVALMLVWAIHDGGYDNDTWYWGALVSLALLAGSVIVLRDRLSVSRRQLLALSLFAAYVGWCYLSMAWAQAPGYALQGANQALLYFLVFALMLVLPWTPEAAIAALLVFVIGAGVIGIVLMFRLASNDHVGQLVIEGRLAAPTGYFNSTAAFFMIGCLTAIGLSARRELPAPMRGLLLAFACCDLQLAVIVQSRGWLFTLPFVAAAALFVVHERFRVILASMLPVLATAIPLRRLLAVYGSSGGAKLGHAAARAGQASLLLCAGAFVLGTLLAWADVLWRTPPLSPARRRALGAALAVSAVLGVTIVGTAATHGHPFRFISRQWNGFSHVQTQFAQSSHFGDVGSGRYDFWRASLDAFVAHPVDGLGEDNFADYYLTHRHTDQEPSWTHSIEMRLLAQTGLVGFALFVSFLAITLVLASRGRLRGPPLARGVVGIALLPLVVWLIYGSIDWFWEVPALSGPALGFLGVAGSLGGAVEVTEDSPSSMPRRRLLASGPPAIAAGALALLAATLVLGLPYLSVRKVSLASNVSSSNPKAALADLATARRLNPLDPEVGRMAGAIALENGEYLVAQQRFRETISAEPGGWFAWLGAGLAASALGEKTAAHGDFAIAKSIDARQPVVTQALDRVYGPHPLTTAQAFSLIKITV